MLFKSQKKLLFILKIHINMGTNYYWRPLITEDQRNKILEKIKNVKTLQEIKNFIFYDILDQNEGEVHIGKSSCGWQFLFNLGIRKHIRGQSLKREDIDEWLRSGIIFDEYDDEISVDSFWKLVDCKKDNMDYDEYYKKYPDPSYFCRGHDQHLDGLRFTKDEVEFS